MYTQIYEVKTQRDLYLYVYRPICVKAWFLSHLKQSSLVFPNYLVQQVERSLGVAAMHTATDAGDQRARGFDFHQPGPLFDIMFF